MILSINSSSGFLLLCTYIHELSISLINLNQLENSIVTYKCNMFLYLCCLLRQHLSPPAHILLLLCDVSEGLFLSKFGEVFTPNFHHHFRNVLAKKLLNEVQVPDSLDVEIAAEVHLGFVFFELLISQHFESVLQSKTKKMILLERVTINQVHDLLSLSF